MGEGGADGFSALLGRWQSFTKNGPLAELLRRRVAGVQAQQRPE